MIGPLRPLLRLVRLGSWRFLHWLFRTSLIFRVAPAEVKHAVADRTALVVLGKRCGLGRRAALMTRRLLGLGLRRRRLVDAIGGPLFRLVGRRLPAGIRERV